MGDRYHKYLRIIKKKNTLSSNFCRELALHRKCLMLGETSRAKAQRRKEALETPQRFASLREKHFLSPFSELLLVQSIVSYN